MSYAIYLEVPLFREGEPTERDCNRLGKKRRESCVTFEGGYKTEEVWNQCNIDTKQEGKHGGRIQGWCVKMGK